jgi:TRAP-type mannitol/chloroaromatic compound transport system permease small subunit
MKFLNTYCRIVDNINEKIGTAAAWLSLLLVLVVCYDVIARYLFRVSSVALQELEWHLFALIFLLTAAYTLMKDEHVRVDLFYNRFSKKAKAWINISGTLLFLIPFSVVMIIASENFVINSFIMKETSPDAGGLPARYILKAVIPFSFFLILLQGIALLFRSIIILKEDD